MGAMTYTVSGKMASFKSASVEPIKSLKVIFKPQQPGTGEPSISNVRPISGWSSIDTTICGTNILHCTTTATTTKTKNVTLTFTRNTAGEVTDVQMSGTASEGNLFYNLNYLANTLHWPPDGKYSTYAYSSQATIPFVADTQQPVDIDGYTVADTTGKWKTYNLVHNPAHKAEWIRIQGMPHSCKNVVFNTTIHPLVCIEEDKGCEFEPYNGITYTTNLGGVYYGGILDLISGELIINWKPYIIDNTSAISLVDATLGIISINLPQSADNYLDGSVLPVIVSSNYTTVSYTTFQNMTSQSNCITRKTGTAENDYILISNNAWINKTLDEIKTDLTTSSIEITYRTLQPVTTKMLSSQILNTRLGRNNIWSSAQNTIEVTYEIHESFEMRIFRQMMAAFDTDGGGNMKLIHSHTITSNYSTTLTSLYTNEIKPYITFGDYNKICIVTFENNTLAASGGKINYLFFSLATDIETVDSNARTGGMIRNDFTNIRNLLLSNDAKCSAGTIIKIYTLNFS